MPVSRRRAVSAVVIAIAGLFAVGCSNSTGPVSSPGGISTQWIVGTGGKFLLQGEILQKYNDLGASNSLLGMPISNEQPGPGDGRYTKFQGGVIYWSPKTGAHIVSGAIRNAWEHGSGGAGGPLGYPTSDQHPIPGGWQQTFQQGTITDTGGQPRVEVQG